MYPLHTQIKMTSHPLHETFTFEEVEEPKTQDRVQEIKNYRQKIKEEYLKDREEHDPWMFMSSWNFETGCGHSCSILMSQCVPCEPEDYNSQHELTTSKEYRARRKFKKIFGEYDSSLLEFHTREEFFAKWSDYLPKTLQQIKDEPCDIDFFMRLHYNFS